MDIRNYQKRIQKLRNIITKCQKEIEELKIKIHNEVMEDTSNRLSNDVKLSETKAENMFYEIAKKKKIKLERQYKLIL